MNRSEEYVAKLCNKTFLSLWNYSTPIGKKNKELCDVLVVCDPDVIIFSVKEIALPVHDDLEVVWERWRKRAIDESCQQIYGAERWIKQANNVIESNGGKTIPFPKSSKVRIHRVGVALGSEGVVPITYGDFGKGFIHIFDEQSLDIVMNELDTVEDFVKYLADKETLFRKGAKVVSGSEEDLLAIYLHNNRSFPQSDLVIIEEGSWQGLIKKAEYIRKKEEDELSYVWDRIIETFCSDFKQGDLIFGNQLTQVELVTRIMARENRFNRRLLGKSFTEFIQMSDKVRARIVPSPSQIMYVFLACPHNMVRDQRAAELMGRCHVVRGIYRDKQTIIGLATEKYETGKGYSFDAIFYDKPEWTPEDEADMKMLQSECGFFKNAVEKRIREDEYPLA
jgi:hypothetical protein